MTVKTTRRPPRSWVRWGPVASAPAGGPSVSAGSAGTGSASASATISSGASSAARALEGLGAIGSRAPGLSTAASDSGLADETLAAEPRPAPTHAGSELAARRTSHWEEGAPTTTSQTAPAIQRTHRLRLRLRRIRRRSSLDRFRAPTRGRLPGERKPSTDRRASILAKITHGEERIPGYCRAFSRWTGIRGRGNDHARTSARLRPRREKLGYLENSSPPNRAGTPASAAGRPGTRSTR